MAQTTTGIKPTDGQKAVVQWKGEPITISFQDVKGLLCPLATDQEVGIFLKTCQSLQLNPFANECFLIKYSTQEKAAFVVAIDSYLKAAETNPNYDGCEAGVILRDSTGKLEFREGAFLLTEEKGNLVGGWARVYRKDRPRPTYVAVNKNECIKLTREGKPTQFWSEPKQPWMLRKSALKRGLVEAFPSLFAGTLATAEIESDIEGTLPQAFQNGDDPDWPKFWVKVQNELGLTEVEAHALLGVESIKATLGNGRTLETIWEDLVAKVQERRMSEDYPQPMDKDYDPLFDDPLLDDIEKPGIDMHWLKESLETLDWADVGKWLREHFKEANGMTVKLRIENVELIDRKDRYSSVFATGIRRCDDVSPYVDAFRRKMESWNGVDDFGELANVQDLKIILSQDYPASDDVRICYPPGDNPDKKTGKEMPGKVHPSELNYKWFCSIMKWSEPLVTIQQIANGEYQNITDKGGS